MSDAAPGAGGERVRSVRGVVAGKGVAWMGSDGGEEGGLGCHCEVCWLMGVLACGRFGRRAMGVCVCVLRWKN